MVVVASGSDYFHPVLSNDSSKFKFTGRIEMWRNSPDSLAEVEH